MSIFSELLQVSDMYLEIKSWGFDLITLGLDSTHMQFLLNFIVVVFIDWYERNSSSFDRHFLFE